MLITKARAPRDNLEKQDLSHSQKTNIRKSNKHQIEYGRIEKVDYSTCRVMIRLDNGELLQGPPVDGKPVEFYFPLLNPLCDIEMRYGPLISGLKTRIHWIGEDRPSSKVWVEIIGSPDHSYLKKDFYANKMDIGFDMSIL